MTDTLAMFTQDQLTNARSLDYVRLVSCLGIDGNGSAARLSDELDRIHAAEVFLGRWPRSLSSDLLGKSGDLATQGWHHSWLHNRAGMGRGARAGASADGGVRRDEPTREPDRQAVAAVQASAVQCQRAGGDEWRDRSLGRASRRETSRQHATRERDAADREGRWHHRRDARADGVDRAGLGHGGNSREESRSISISN
jgi:hypothetical protein